MWTNEAEIVRENELEKAKQKLLVTDEGLLILLLFNNEVHVWNDLFNYLIWTGYIYFFLNKGKFMCHFSHELVFTQFKIFI